MRMKIVGCLLLVILLKCNRFHVCGNHIHPLSVYRVSEQPATNDIKISKNVTIHRNGYGRLLRLLALLKGFHHRKHDDFNPYLISRLWRASFEFELKPHPTFENGIIPGTYYPIHQFGVVGAPHGGAGNSGLGSNSIDSIFHFGNNEQQSSVTIGGSNQIIKRPDERDEIPAGHNAVNNENEASIDPVISMPTTEVEEKSERFLRHAIQPRTDGESDDDVEDITNTNTPTIDENEQTTSNSVTTTDQSLTIPQTETENESTEGLTETPTASTTGQSLTILQTENAYVSTEGLTETSTTSIPSTMTSESGSQIANKVDQVSSIQPEWMGLGYYDSGIHKPEFIQSVEFTTGYPSSAELVGDHVHYVTYEAPFKPSARDYSNAQSSNYFVPLLRYFKR